MIGEAEGAGSILVHLHRREPPIDTTRIFTPLQTVFKLTRFPGMTDVPKAPLLIVEDEVFIRMIAVDALEDRGFSIVEAGNASEALEILERTPDIALIFTDVNMPGNIDGMDLAEEVARRWPHIEIIVTSGGVRLTSDDIPDAGKFLAKPYAMDRLVELVNEQLSHRPL
jgi:DNA-binding NtrC family response regulator